MRAISLMLSLVFALALSGAASAKDLVVFAAASLKDALDGFVATLPDGQADNIVISYESSGALARQIELGAPADVFISANEAWMDKLEGEGLLRPGTRRDLLGNALVLIASAPAQADVTISPDLDLSGLLGDGFLAMGEVNSVPAGIYGKAALEYLGLWDSVKSRVAQTANVRAALALVARGEAPLGVVYATDARAEPKVHQIGVFPPGSHAPIVYPGAVIGESTHPMAKGFLQAIATPKGKAHFKTFGFEVMD